MKMACRSVNELYEQKIPYNEMTNDEINDIIKFEKEKSYNEGVNSEEVKLLRDKFAEQNELNKNNTQKSLDLLNEVIKKSEENISNCLKINEIKD